MHGVAVVTDDNMAGRQNSQKKRFQWTADNRISVLNQLIEKHEDWKRAKRNGVVQDFYDEVGMVVGAEGSVVQTMLKNLGTDYRKVKMAQTESGGETDDLQPRPTLKDSVELYETFDTWYRLYYPKGGSACPDVVITPQSMKRPRAQGGTKAPVPFISYGDDGNCSDNDDVTDGRSQEQVASCSYDSSSRSSLSRARSPSPIPSVTGKRTSSPPPDSGRSAAKRARNSDILEASMGYQDSNNLILAEIRDLLKALVQEIQILRVEFLDIHKMEVAENLD